MPIKHCLIGFTTDMTLEQFQQRHRTGVVEKPKLFALIPADPPASIQQIAETESQLGVQLPAKYQQFLSAFGGGSFGLINIFSACSDSDFYLPMRREESRNYLPDDLVPFSDDGAGGLYVMKVSGQALGDAVFYWNQDGGLDTTEFEDILEFIARYAYAAA
ncbi:SMI1/KNR4 family protein [Luteolibacter sp. GHJ8]|uniref:SMI1/KNR4 family protein n=1 Tax=Luteolibacter rhizosphaerae TaxID=2989719 RepID=A0ABT3GCN2_9BACT|nr:SMI1/KNR4 family protein [Luteolibacter rhizosphaerae]MCW1916970.1 SMI1/KNR4 family protein [Luteolibacter rhizosphaerae]